VIALTQRVVVDERGERRDALDQRWSRMLARVGFLPLLLPNDLEVARELLERLRPRGILLTGGNDLAAYGGDAPERDELELFLVEHALAHRLPLLGVCRGMQVIQHALGVALEPVAGHVAPRQRVAIGGRSRWVNSFHRFGARESAPALEVWARADDGVVEAVCHKSAPLVGVMWHPERMAPFAQRDLALLRTHFGGKA
jgi:putative glutamine amidotransferase